MKKLGLLIMPLLAVSFLSNCGCSKTEPTYSITFKNDGDTDKKIENIKAGSVVTENIPTPSIREGYTFIGWCTDTESKNVFDFKTIKIYQDYTLYSGWKGDDPTPGTFTLTFDCTNCKAYDENDEEVTSVDVVAPSPYVVYSNFYFKGVGLYRHPLESSISIEKTTTKESVDFEYNPITGDIIIPIVGNLTITAEGIGKSLEECSWDEISEISTSGRAQEFFSLRETKRVQLQHQDKNGDGADKISEGELYQTVRIIGFNEDYENVTKNEDDEWVKSNPIGITFEFADQISDENGLSLATYWNDTAAWETSNHKYDESSINRALNGTTNDINWFRYYGENEDTPETGKNLFFATEPNYKKSLIKMLPNGLTKEGILKAPSKFININDGDGWEEGISKQKLFLLSSKEMGNIDEEYTRFEEEHTTPYSYYEGSQKSDRIKNQVNRKKGSRANWAEVISGAYTEMQKYGFAGYYESSGSKGGYSWLRSPSTNNDFAAWHLSNDGDFGAGIFGVFQQALGIAPAFCI